MATATVSLDVCVRRDGGEETAASVGPHIVLLDVELCDCGLGLPQLLSGLGLMLGGGLRLG